MYARVAVYAGCQTKNETGGWRTQWNKAESGDQRWRGQRSVSRDSGLTWSPPESVDIPNFDSKLSLAAVNDNRLVMAYNPNPERFPLMLAVSDDRGDNWRPAGVIDPGPGSISYPTLHMDRTGRLHISYTWKRREIFYKVYTAAVIAAL